jgi:uncharacterized RDD family membrane protein YckC
MDGENLVVLEKILSKLMLDYPVYTFWKTTNFTLSLRKDRKEKFDFLQKTIRVRRPLAL